MFVGVVVLVGVGVNVSPADCVGVGDEVLVGVIVTVDDGVTVAVLVGVGVFDGQICDAVNNKGAIPVYGKLIFK